MKEKILQLRAEGKSYNQIKDEVGCSIGNVCYHCGKGQKEKYRIRHRKNRQEMHPFQRKLEWFFHGISSRGSENEISTKRKKSSILLINKKIYSFHNRYKGDNMDRTFDFNDIIAKFGENPKCYLTGEEINIYEPRTYQFDHIIPRSRGGSNTLDNLGICTRQANLAKNDMTADEFIHFCKRVVEHTTK